MRLAVPARSLLAAGLAAAAAAAAGPGDSAAARGDPDPDGEVKRKGQAFIGLGIVNLSGEGQTAKVRVPQGQTGVFFFRYTNDGAGSGSIFVGGCEPRGDGFGVRYFAEGNNVTAEVNAGTLQFDGVVVGEATPKVRAEVKVRPSAEDGAVADACVPGRSGTAADEPGWKVKVQ